MSDSENMTTTRKSSFAVHGQHVGVSRTNKSTYSKNNTRSSKSGAFRSDSSAVRNNVSVSHSYNNNGGGGGGGNSSSIGGRKNSRFSSSRPQLARGGYKTFNRGSNNHGNYSYGRNFKRNSKKKNAVLDVSSFINKTVVKNENVTEYVPQNTFNDFAIANNIKQQLITRGYKTPTPIQDKIIPHILNGNDVVGLANTGTGKTAAFLIPLIEKILKNRHEQVLILTPTRELAIQIEEELTLLTKRMSLLSTVVVGGVSINQQIYKLRARNHFIIGTTGRVMDLMKRNKLNLSNTRNIVLDEVDRMLDMGFINDIRYIIGFVPKERHTLCFSATLAPEIERLINDFLIKPITVSVKTQHTPINIEQDIVKIAGRDKADVLYEFLSKAEYKKTIVFGRTKHGVEKLAQKIKRRGVRVESIHGDKSHNQRQNALKKFKMGHVTALLATDVAARGLDISGITHVINFDIPETRDDYIHRIGRTGRGANSGKALTFVD